MELPKRKNTHSALCSLSEMRSQTATIWSSGRGKGCGGWISRAWLIWSCYPNLKYIIGEFIFDWGRSYENPHCWLATNFLYPHSYPMNMPLISLTGWWCNNHLEKYEFVNGKDDISYMKWKIRHVWSHQPDEDHMKNMGISWRYNDRIWSTMQVSLGQLFLIHSNFIIGFVW